MDHFHSSLFSDRKSISSNAKLLFNGSRGDSSLEKNEFSKEKNDNTLNGFILFILCKFYLIIYIQKFEQIFSKFTFFLNLIVDIR